MTIAAEITIQVGLHLLSNSVTQPAEKSMLARWAKEFNAYNFKTARRQKILNAVLEGYDTYSEISLATDIPDMTVRRIIQNLVKSGNVKQERCKKKISGKAIYEYRFEFVKNLN